MTKRKLALSTLAGALALAGTTAFAANCDSPSWDAEVQYKGGELVTWDAAAYKAKWWIKGEAPDQNNQWGPWEHLEDCDIPTEPPIEPPVEPPVDTGIPELGSNQFTTDGSSEVIVPITLNGAEIWSLVNISQGALANNLWSLTGDNVIISSNAFSGLADGEYEHRFDFTNADSLHFNVTVDAGIVVVPTPTMPTNTLSYTKNSGEKLFIDIDLDGDAIVSLIDLDPVLGGNYEVSSFDFWQHSQNTEGVRTYILDEPYINTKTAGSSYQFQFNFRDQPNPLYFTVNVADEPIIPPPAGVITLLPADATLTDAAITEGQVDIQHGTAEWEVNVEGLYRVDFYFESPYGDKANTFYAGPYSEQVTTNTTTNIEVHSVEVNFPAGTSTVGVTGAGGNWGYIFVDHIDLTKVAEPIIEPTVSPSSASFVVSNAVPVSFNVSVNDFTFTGASANGSNLAEGADFNFAAGIFTLTADYLNSLTLGAHGIDLSFSSAETTDVIRTVTVNAEEAPVYQPNVSPGSVTVSAGNASDVTLAVNEGSFTFSGLSADGAALTNGSDFSFNNGSLTVNATYLNTLAQDSNVNLELNFVSASHGYPTLTVPVFVVGALNGTCFDVSQLTLVGDTIIEGDRAKITGKTGSEAYWQFNVDKAGQYEAVITYSTEGGDKIVSYILDDDGYTGMTWPDVPVSAPEDMTFVHNLDAGVHKIGMANREGDWGWASLHNLCVNFMGSLDIISPTAFSSLPAGSDISVEFVKDSTDALTYSVNDGAVQSYSGTSPLIIPNAGDGLYDLSFGVAGTQLGEMVRLQVGDISGPQYVDTLGSMFVLGNAPFYFNGSNQYYLMYKPEAMAEDFFKRAEHLGMTSVRTWMFCNDDRTHDGVCINQQTGAGEFLLTKGNLTSEEQAIVDRSYELFDNYVYLAHQYNQKLVLSLADEWDYFGNLNSFGTNPYSNRSAIDLFKGFITELLSHHNTLTGYSYAEDPAIMMWELANEPRCSSGCDEAMFKAWASEISAHIKSLAPNHLVSIGAETSFGFNGTGDDLNFTISVNDVDTIDAISAHLYPTWWNMTEAQTLGNFDQLAEVGRTLNKPTYIGEFSWPVTNQSSAVSDLQTRHRLFVDWYNKAEQHADAIGGMLLWQLSGKEWGNGNTPLGGCQWCSGPYGEPTNAWTANNDGFQTYCAITPEEENLTAVGAPGNNVEGSGINIAAHKPVCDLMKERSAFYQSLNNDPALIPDNSGSTAGDTGGSNSGDTGGGNTGGGTTDPDEPYVPGTGANGPNDPTEFPGSVVTDSDHTNYAAFADSVSNVDPVNYISQTNQSLSLPGYGNLYDEALTGKGLGSDVGIAWAGWNPYHYTQNKATKLAVIDDSNIKRISFIPTYFIATYEEGIRCNDDANTLSVSQQADLIGELLTRDVRINYRPHIDPIKFSWVGDSSGTLNPGSRNWRGLFDELDPMGTDYVCVIDKGIEVLNQVLASASLPLAEPIRFDIGAELMESTKKFPEQWVALVEYTRAKMAEYPLVRDNVYISHNFSHHIQYLMELENHPEYFQRIVSGGTFEQYPFLLFVDDMNAGKRAALADYIRALDTVTVSQYMPMDVTNPITDRKSLNIPTTAEDVRDALIIHEQNFLQKVLMGKLGIHKNDIPPFHLGEYGMGIKGLITPNVWDMDEVTQAEIISYEAHQLHADIAIRGLMLYMQDPRTIAKSLMIWVSGAPYDIIGFYNGDGPGLDVGDAEHGYAGKSPYNAAAHQSLKDYWMK